MLGDLSQDIIGTDPKYLPIVDHSWLKPEVYDNYPSDNNSVRIQPKLAELWGQDESTGINLVPNLTVQSLGQRSAGEEVDGIEVVREAKKAMMMGLKGRSLTAHIRARFASNQIETAKEALQKVSEEQGLLGNVYIDASAFSSATDAERFLIQHRNRLARDIIVNESGLSVDVVAFLANKFHKNVVASIDYNESLFKKYKAHLVDIGNIDSDFVIDSKEALRQAFLAEPVTDQPVTAKKVKEISEERISEELIKNAKEQEIVDRLANEEMLFREVRPIIVFAREQLYKGKTGNNLKEVLKKKYASGDLKKAVKYLAIVLPSQDMGGEVDRLVAAKRLPRKIGLDLKKLLKEFPIKEAQFEDTRESNSAVGVPGYFHALTGEKNAEDMSKHREAALGLLRKGKTLEQVKGALMKELASDKADQVLASAVNDYNIAPVGIKANTFEPAPKKKVVADLPEKETLPDPSTIEADTKEYVDFFAGSDMGEINIDPLIDNKSITEVGGLSSTIGLDQIL